MFSKHTYRSWLWFVHDGVLWCGCLTLALLVRFKGHPPAVEWEYLWRFLPLSGAALLFGLFRNGVYRQELSDEWAWRNVWWGWIVGMGVSLAVLFGLKIPFSRGVFVAASLTYLAGLVLDRVLVRFIYNVVGSDRTPLVLGVGFERQDRDRLTGRLERSARFQWMDSSDMDASFGNLAEERPDLLVVNHRSLDFDQVQSLFEFGSRFQVPVRLFPDSRALFLSRTTDESWAGLRLLRSDTHHRFQQVMAAKTLFDMVGSILLIILALPLWLGGSLLVLLFDGWPVIYTQKRVGRGGELFDMYKFRTMVEDAEEGPKLTEGPEDPRITTVGRVLRRWSLDELPQLFNVLKGDMSLVGPRPEVPDITEGYSPEQRRVLWIKPGLTGLSQVSGREQLDLDRKLEIDQVYLTEYSMGLDLWILAKTLFVVLRGEGTN